MIYRGSSHILLVGLICIGLACIPLKLHPTCTLFMYIPILSTCYSRFLYLVCFNLYLSTALNKILDVTSEVQ